VNTLHGQQGPAPRQTGMGLHKRSVRALALIGLAVTATAAAGATARAAVWHLDSSFGRGGIAHVPLTERGTDSQYLPGPGDGGSLLAPGPSGSLLVGGYGREKGRFLLARLSAHGRAVGSFGHDGVAAVPAIYSQPQHPPRLFALAGGGLLVLGLDRADRLVAVRLDSRGQLDRSFGHNGVAQYKLAHAVRGAIVAAAALLANGDILAAYYRREVPQPVNEPRITPGLGEGPLQLVRLLPSGVLDRSFGSGGFLRPGGQPPETGEAVAAGVSIAPDGSVLLAYEQAAVPSGGNELPAVQELDPTGADAPGFANGASGAGVAFLPFTPHFQGVDSVIFDGLFALPGGPVEVSFGGGGELFRFTAAGTPDPTFGGSGHASMGFQTSLLALAPDGETFAVQAGSSLKVAGTLASGASDPGLGSGRGRRFGSHLPALREGEERPALALLATDNSLSVLDGENVVRLAR
jgi:hypothetical protein